MQLLNHVLDPYHIPPGKVIRIPSEWSVRRPGEVEIIDFYGTATLKRANSFERFPIEEKLCVAIRDEISTGQDSQVTLKFSDHSRLQMESESDIRLKQTEILGRDAVVVTEIEQKSGCTVNTVPRQSGPASRFRIKTPSAVSLVRDTRFHIGADKQSSTTYSEVLEGLVGMSAHHKRIMPVKQVATVR